MLTLPAYAKINLTLEVLGSRDDGYHEIASVFQTIDLADSLSFQSGDGIDLDCDIPYLVSPQNSVLRAAEALREETGCEKGALIRLRKHIPIGGGLGGHSADQAAALKGLNELWGLGLEWQKLLQLAAKLSSDTSFFLHGGTALIQGRGEKVTPLSPLPETWLVLLRPTIKPVPNKTARLYARLIPSHFTPGHLTQIFIQQLSQGRPADDSLLFNVFELVAFDFFPKLDWYRRRMLEAGAAAVHLAGAGPTLFALLPDRTSGEFIFNRLQSEEHEVYLVRTINPGLKE
jgi:4-diphosphocytidyl-2-C-methyl-D-erythritol kinase